MEAKWDRVDTSLSAQLSNNLQRLAGYAKKFFELRSGVDSILMIERTIQSLYGKCCDFSTWIEMADLNLVHIGSCNDIFRANGANVMRNFSFMTEKNLRSGL